MARETTLVATIAVGLAVAFLFGFAAARVGLPPVVGYLIAGVIVGPFTPGYVADGRLAGQLAEVGIILLTFGVGLHFSLRDLSAVRRIALPGAAVQIAIVTAIGAGVARLWRWNTAGARVFGLALSVGSTVVLLKALEGRGLLDSVNGRIAMGWLVAQDLAMVLALVLLPALAPSPGAGGAGPPGDARSDVLAAVARTLGKVAAFIALMLFVGARAIPAAAVLSITLNPLAFRAAESIGRWLRAHPQVLARLERPGALPVAIDGAGIQAEAHAIVVGYARVGRTICAALARRRLPYVVVEQAREIAEDLRQRGVPTIFGDAARPGILQHAHPERACLIVVTAPDPFHARQIVDLARRLNPAITTVVRTHSEAEQAFLEARGAAFVVMGERELALSRARYALRGLGVAPDEAEASVQALRPTTPASAVEAAVLEPDVAARPVAASGPRFGEGS